MSLSNLDTSSLPRPTQTNFGARAERSQSMSLPASRMRVVDDGGAVLVHQLNEPLTALLLYLHEIADRGENPPGGEIVSDSMRELVKRALLETERACEIMTHVRQPFGAPIEAAAAATRSCEAVAGPPASVNGWDPASSSHQRSDHSALTRREREVLAVITGGASNKEGGRKLGISSRTFEAHRAHIMGKFGARNAADLVRMALCEIR